MHVSTKDGGAVFKEAMVVEPSKGTMETSSERKIFVAVDQVDLIGYAVFRCEPPKTPENKRYNFRLYSSIAQLVERRTVNP